MVKVALSYSVPLQTEENWDLFKPDVQRFIDSWFEYPPGMECYLFALCLGNDPTTETKEMFRGIPTEFITVRNVPVCSGADAAGALELCKKLDGWFQIGMGARVHFFRRGAVREMAIARVKHGPGLYGCTCSKEARVHIRPSFYGMDTNYLRLYPGSINSPEAGTQFEIGNEFGELSLTKWSESIGIPSYMVYWTGVFQNKADWFSQPNTFRKGDQSNLLVWDKRTDLYAAADEEEKLQLRRLAFGLAREHPEA